MDNLYILSNSPGEISGWVKPTASAVALEQLNIKTTLVLLPCPYASGMEREYGVTMDGIDYCASFREAWGKDERKSIVLQLGGDPFFGAALSIKKKLHGSYIRVAPDGHRVFVIISFLTKKTYIIFRKKNCLPHAILLLEIS